MPIIFVPLCGHRTKRRKARRRLRKTQQTPAAIPRPSDVGFSTRKSRDLDSALRENVEQWKNRDRVRKRRGVFKNLGYNPCGYTIDRKQPLKQTGCMLVNSSTLRATLGKRRSVIPGHQDLGPKEPDPVFSYALRISGGKLGLSLCRNDRAYKKNLAFLQGGRKSCPQLKYIVKFICEYGITVRLYRKLSLAATLVRAGKANRALSIYRSVGCRVGYLRRKTKHAIIVKESSFDNSSQFSDW